MRKYRGFIVNVTVKENEKYNLPTTKTTFKVNGAWSDGNKEISSYIIVDENGEEIEAFDGFQFTRDKSNNFYLEAIN